MVRVVRYPTQGECYSWYDLLELVGREKATELSYRVENFTFRYMPMAFYRKADIRELLGGDKTWKKRLK